MDRPLTPRSTVRLVGAAAAIIVAVLLVWQLVAASHTAGTVREFQDVHQKYEVAFAVAEGSAGICENYNYLGLDDETHRAGFLKSATDFVDWYTPYETASASYRAYLLANRERIEDAARLTGIASVDREEQRVLTNDQQMRANIYKIDELLAVALVQDNSNDTRMQQVHERLRLLALQS